MRITRFVYFAVFLALTASASDYHAKGVDEVDIFAETIIAEFAANHWKKSDFVCISVGPEYPNEDLVAALRRRKLNVCSMAEWRKNFGCKFAVQMKTPKIDGNEAQIAVDSADYRGIIDGTEDLATLLRKGEYRLRRVDSTWKIVEFAPEKAAL